MIKKTKFSGFFLLTLFLFFIIILFQINFTSFQDKKVTTSSDVPIILWWTPFGSDEEFRKCGNGKCYFTNNRSVITDSQLKAILFYGSNIKLNDLPLPRQVNVIWGLLHEESPRNNLILVHKEAIQLFNYSSTFSRFSDLPINLVDLPNEDELTGNKYFLSTMEKSRLIKQKKLAPVLFIQSNCDTMNGRDLYVSQLMKLISIDSYGTCINNKHLPKQLKENYLNHLDSDEFRKFVGQYKFTLAIENAVCEDYITEKLWRPLIVGSVPIYYGSPSFKDWLPNNNSAISINDFEDPKKLTEYLKELINDDVKYNSFLKHKLLKDSITNNRLLDILQKRPNDLFNIFDYYVKEFECLICRNSISQNSHHKVTKKHYNCSKPKNLYKNGKKNQWTDMWEIESCAAKLLYQSVTHNKTIEIDKFNKEKLKMFQNNKCN
ncbi:alpha-(1,3)-fucosyltransferase B isoform X1 [Cotesia glomerata]|uniref:Fucosyltransferase n=1 Tax=Cotesia glomerata TaxID=32391 RepID=A0AAV7J887_COTGL|nr:alpha-(1,3)-fucosyltransferase B isoform X1 [Cotesia glomerata]XP_044598919.1 alpha-(1,3)-fucosyltransferase B isoform X1 [Cotesia glomerata]XP_044598920.1 alpha-(1,3)-fucosyltransferase B isoform X1 [Cotesia glomerata]XP_044598921.1 alpha-(1,3)-fucosyltransferase B isoform X1 [Cotesia glomerata]KAH0567983.1 hypothetical protein KQX54_017125 [Cotesia glomerata]